MLFSLGICQVELLTSLKSLYKHVDISQLPTEFEGTFPYAHSSWVCFRMVRKSQSWMAQKAGIHCMFFALILYSDLQFKFLILKKEC